MKKDKQKACPVCKKMDEVIEIVYGEPTELTSKKAKEGKVWIGGCVISDEDNKYYCKRDKLEF